MGRVRKVVAILIGLVVFEAVLVLLMLGLRPLRHEVLSEPAWWASRVAAIFIGLLVALFVGSRLWPKRPAPGAGAAGDA